MIGAQGVVLLLWAGFGERHRSRRRPADHDFPDPLRGARRWRNSTTPRLNRPPRLEEADALRQRPKAGARPRSRLTPMAAPLLSRSDAVGCPGSGEVGPEMRMGAIGRLRAETARCCRGIGAPALHRALARQADGFANSGAGRRGRRRSAGDQARFLETEEGKVRVTVIKRCLEELNKHADDEERGMDLGGRRKVVRDLISSNARETDQDFGKLDQHMKELRGIDKELQAANKINPQPDFPGLASPEIPDKASKE
jgi:hypothetical protein